MTPPGAVTGVVADSERRVRREIATRAGALFVDGAPDAFPDFAFERDAARRRRVGSAQANERRGQRQRQPDRDARTLATGQIGTMEIDAKRRATRTARKTHQVRH